MVLGFLVTAVNKDREFEKNEMKVEQSACRWER
jgi:hypothetical protein